MKGLRHTVFWPPFLLCAIAIGLNLWDRKLFEQTIQRINDSILLNFGSVFAWVALLSVGLCVWVLLSPISRVRIGGESAKPALSFPSWASIVLCTNTGAGILFWSIAEPMFHITSPPVSLGLQPTSWEAAKFAMSTLFLHWSFTPAAIFALPGLVFGLCYFNLKLPFSLASSLYPILGDKLLKKVAAPLDSIALFTLILGMAASLDTGVLSLAGGLQHLVGWKSAPESWIAIGVVIVISFILSSLTGVEKGIKFLSNMNSFFFLGLGVFIFFMGKPFFIAVLGWAGLADYVRNFFSHSLFLGFSHSDPWPRQWTIFYWAVWMAWAPITAGFLGRIAYGYTVRQFLAVNLIIPSLFAIIWMSIFAGTTIDLQLNQGLDLAGQLKSLGAESLAYTVFSRFPLASVIVPVFLLLVFISYVTSADSNTLVMATMCSREVDRENPKPKAWLQIFWGALVGTIALTMLSLSGIEGIKTLSYLGGVPALIFVVASAGSLVMLMLFPEGFGLKARKSKHIEEVAASAV